MEGGTLDRGRTVSISKGGQVMNARCGLAECDCEYTIGGLLRRLELISEQAQLTVKQTRKDPAPARCTRPIHPCPDCYDLGYQDGYEAERQPIGE